MLGRVLKCIIQDICCSLICCSLHQHGRGLGSLPFCVLPLVVCAETVWAEPELLVARNLPSSWAASSCCVSMCWVLRRLSNRSRCRSRCKSQDILSDRDRPPLHTCSWIRPTIFDLQLFSAHRSHSALPSVQMRRYCIIQRIMCQDVKCACSLPCVSFPKNHSFCSSTLCFFQYMYFSSLFLPVVPLTQGKHRTELTANRMPPARREAPLLSMASCLKVSLAAMAKRGQCSPI